MVDVELRVRDQEDRDQRLLTTLQQLLAIEALDRTAALSEAADLVSAALSADKVDAFLYQDEIESLVALGTSDTPMGRRQHELGLDRLQLANDGRAVEVYRTGGSFITGRADEDPAEVRGLIEGLGIRSQILCPLRVRGECRGVLSAVSARADFFDEDDLRFLEAVAGWIGIVLHRAELIEERAQAAVRRGRQEAAAEVARLTRRQQEIASLVAEGLTNDEIATRLIIASGTAANHIEQILGRLGLKNRAQLAVWTVEHGLFRTETEAGQP
jgi:DNA-binding CsgD family transcriptional regulator